MASEISVGSLVWYKVFYHHYLFGTSCNFSLHLLAPGFPHFKLALPEASEVQRLRVRSYAGMHAWPFTFTFRIRAYRNQNMQVVNQVVSEFEWVHCYLRRQYLKKISGQDSAYH
jgi:hypothetical protein